MSTRHFRTTVFRFALLAAALLAAGWLVAGAATAGDLDKLDASLKLIPDDAALYSNIMHGGELVQAIGRSNAWAKIQQMPLVQMAMMSVPMALPPGAMMQLQAASNNPEGRKILKLLGDMASDEMFVYGDPSVVKFITLVQDVFGGMQSPAAMVDQWSMMSSPEQMRGRMALRALAHDVDLIGVPNLLFGFKLKSTAVAKEELAKLEQIARMNLDKAISDVDEPAKGRLKSVRDNLKAKVGDVDYFVIRLDGSMIPWDQLPTERLKEMEPEEGDVQKIIDRVKACKLVIAMGVREDYVLLSIGSSLECIEKFGKAPRLIDRPELKPIEKLTDKHLISISYVSKAMGAGIDRQKKNLKNLLELAEKLVSNSSLSDDQKERIIKDAKAFVHDVEERLPEPAAQTAASFLTDRGIEGYQYTWGTFGRMDGSKPLDLLKHVGGDPIFGFVARNKVEMADYEMLVKWIKTGYGYFHEYALPQIPEETRTKVEKFLAAAIPLFGRLDRAQREMVIPALAEGQGALVLDRKLASKQFIGVQPPTDKPMPMIEPAVVVGVSDPDLLKKGMGEYRSVINGLITALRESDDDGTIPADLQIPEPKVTDVSAGKLYGFTLPADWQVDAKIAPTLGLGEHVGVASISADHARRLLEPTPLKVGGVLKDTDRPLATAVWVDWAGLVDAAMPWVDYAIDQATAEQGEGGMPKPMITSSVHAVTDVLKVFHTFTNESYFEDGVLVNHGLLELHDVPK